MKKNTKNKQSTLNNNYLSAIKAGFVALFFFIFNTNSLAADIKLPVLGDNSSGIVSIQQEYSLGQAWLKAFRGYIKQHDDPLLQTYLEQLTFSLVANSDLDDSRLTLVLINNPTINAFAVPGGVIGIHTGIFSYADNEDQLASILSHEIAHLSQRHFARGIEAQRNASMISLAGLLATFVVSSQGGTDAGLAALTATQAFSIDQQLRYSRSNEQEADRLGIKIMERAGRDPEAAADILQKMLAQTRYKTNRLPEFLLTHPVTDRRVVDTRSRTFKDKQRHYPDSYDYYIMKARALIALQDDAKYSVKFFQQRIEANTLQQDAANYGLSLAYLRLKKNQLAKRIITELLEKKPFYPAFIFTDISVDIAMKNHPVAFKKLNAQIQLNQNNFPLRMLQADALWKTHEYDEAASILTKISRQRPQDPTVWYQLAEVRGLAGNISGVHEARAEYFILIGALESAKQQLNFAANLLKADFKRLSIVKQRLTEIDKIEKSLKKL